MTLVAKTENYAVKNTPRMNVFVQEKVYERIAGCITPIYNQHTIVCGLHASVV